MENKNISQIAMDRIKENRIVPISRSIFSIKRVLFWVVVATSFIVGAFIFSFVLYALFNNDWYLYDKLGLSLVFRTLPYFWILSLAVFTILGEFYYRKTLLGHRRGLVVIVSIYLISTTLFGSVFYVVGFGDIIERSLSDTSPLYRNIILNHREVWTHPEEGLLSGEIIFINDNEIQIVDMDGYLWIINREGALIRGNIEVGIGNKIKIIGSKMDGNLFKAEEIRPWFGMGMNNRNLIIMH